MNENRSVWIWILVAIALLSLFGNFSGYGMMGYGMGFGFPLMVLFWGGVAWLIFVNATQTKSKDEDPLTILKKRYASGEITQKQFKEMKLGLK